jgi:DNA-binding response OmpR family regulator
MSIVKKRVLIVDDDRELVESVRTALITRGYEVLIARDGAEALSRLEQDRPDVMLLDLVMPRRSGFSVLDRMNRRAMPASRIIMMTANDEVRHRDAARLQGVSAFLSKPFPIEQLISEVETALGC